ncbi:hypothetical protein Ciccas_002261 [Cichlidogyrus casuarinus]|uniref:Uncharacterized protein n=1 Tax=Cichlidogyrus casuarinus TaxID=1844966 RepID=A0ABD2QHQ7_9PLAT
MLFFHAITTWLTLVIYGVHSFPDPQDIIPAETLSGLIREPRRLAQIERFDVLMKNHTFGDFIAFNVSLQSPPAESTLFHLSVRTQNLSVNSHSENNILEVNAQLLALDKKFQGIALSFDSDNAIVATVTNAQWYLFTQIAMRRSYPVYVNYSSHDIGKGFIRVWVRPVRNLPIALDQESESTFGVWKFVYSTEEQVRNYWSSVDPGFVRIEPEFGYKLKIERKKSWTYYLFQAVLMTFLLLITFAMGCDLKLKVVKSILKKPVGPVIGFVCQYAIMPSVSYFTPLMRDLGFGLFVIGCSPGGGASNFWSFILGGDISLSMTMTFISTCAAFVMLPLLLATLGPFFYPNVKYAIPFMSLFLSLTLIVGPCGLGILLRWRKEAWAKKVVRMLKPLGGLFMVFILTFGVYANLEIYRLMSIYPIAIPIGAALPWGAFLISACLALALKQPKPFVLTIAIETMMQNIGIAIQILLFNMPKPEGEIGTVMPLIIAIFTPIPLYFALLGKVIYSNFFKKDKPKSSPKTKSAEFDVDDVMPINALKTNL